MRKAFAILAVLLLAASILQLYFAAMGVFSNPDDDLFAVHGFNGQYVLKILPLILIVVALLAKVGRRLVWFSVWFLILSLFQLVLFILTGVLFGITEESENVPLGATIFLSLHGLVGLAMIALSFEIARRALAIGFPRDAKAKEPAVVA